MYILQRVLSTAMHRPFLHRLRLLGIAVTSDLITAIVTMRINRAS
jgi:hypothetical protein